MQAPYDSRTAAFSSSVPVIRPLRSSAVDQALASEIKAISATLAVRRVVEVRLIRRGLAAIRPTRSAPSRAEQPRWTDYQMVGQE